MHLQVLCPDTKEVEEMVNTKGQNLFYESTENRILCCKVRKVNPINRILPTLDGWITGIRKEHSKNRNSMQMFQIDEQHGGILKINPIIDWSLEQIMEQIRERQMPYNALLDQNYSSIGCAPCTRAIKPGEDLRAGRWWWESQGLQQVCLPFDLDLATPGCFSSSVPKTPLDIFFLSYANVSATSSTAAISGPRNSTEPAFFAFAASVELKSSTIGMVHVVPKTFPPPSAGP